MKTDIKSLQEAFKYSYEMFESSRKESRVVEDLYHNRQYSSAQLNTLALRGQPAETFNVIKLFGRLLVGYYSKVATTVQINPRQEDDTEVAKLLNDVVNFTFEDNHFVSKGDRIKLDGILSGMMCAHLDVRDTGKRDQFERPINRIEINHVPAREILLDPMSRKSDNSDARFIKRFKWVTLDYLRNFITETGKDPQPIIDKLGAMDNHVNQNDTEFDVRHPNGFASSSKQHDTYLLVHSVITDDKNRTWSIYWIGNDILSKEEVTYRQVKFPYRVQILSNSDKAEYYGIFREIVATQYAINQAIVKIQLMANSKMILVEKGAVADIAKFRDAINRVNAIVPVLKFDKIQVHNQSAEISEQYVLIDRAFDRIQRLLGINDSFLGQAFASDSGRKVQLQQGATVNSLQFLTGRIEDFYRYVGEDVANLAKQYYTANEALRMTDARTGFRWSQLNEPIKIPIGIDAEGNVKTRYKMEEVVDPASGEPMIDKKSGRYVVAPLPKYDTEIAFTDTDISVKSVAYNDEDEKAQLIHDAVIQGSIGQALLQANPAAFFRAGARAMKLIRTSESLAISEDLLETAEMLDGKGVEEQQQHLANGSQAGSSQGGGQQLAVPKG